MSSKSYISSCCDYYVKQRNTTTTAHLQFYKYWQDAMWFATSSLKDNKAQSYCLLDGIYFYKVQNLNSNSTIFVSYTLKTEPPTAHYDSVV